MSLDFALLIIRLKKIPFIAIGAFFLVTAGLFVFRTAWQEPHLEALRTQWFEKRKLASGTTGRDSVTIYRQGTADLATFMDRMPFSKEFVRVVSDLYETAANNSLTIKEMTYKREDLKGRPVAAYAISLAGTATYAGVKSFIADLERSRELLVVDDVAMFAGKGDEGQVELKLTLTAYLRTEGK